MHEGDAWTVMVPNFYYKGDETTRGKELIKKIKEVKNYMPFLADEKFKEGLNNKEIFSSNQAFEGAFKVLFAWEKGYRPKERNLQKDKITGNMTPKNATKYIDLYNYAEKHEKEYRQ